MGHVTRPRCHTYSIGRTTTTLTQIIIKHQHCGWRRSISNPSIVRHNSFTILSWKTICRFCQPRSYGTRHRWISLCCVPSHKVSTSSTSQDLLIPSRQGCRELHNHGGVAIFYSDRFSEKRLNLGFSPTTFEVLACSLRSSSIIYTRVVIYRPGSGQVTDTSFDEITTLLETVATFQSQVVISGDFNIHVDDLNDLHGHHLLQILDSFDMVQNITGSTHKGGHTLDLVITRRNSPPTGYRVDQPVYSDHSLVLCAFSPMNFAVHHRTKNVRFWRHLDRDSFRKSLLGSQLCGCTDTLLTISPSALFCLYAGIPAPHRRRTSPGRRGHSSRSSTNTVVRQWLQSCQTKGQDAGKTI